MFNLPILVSTHTENATAVANATILENSLNTFFAQLQASEATEDGSLATCCESGILNIDRFLPNWVIQEKAERGGNALTIFDFIQKYYDWLYCDNDCSGSGLVLENKILDIIDVEKTKEKYYTGVYFSYLGEYDPTESPTVLESDTIKFIKNIKTKFNLKKGSIDSLKVFFSGLFSIEKGTIEIYYPKTEILRLNSGRFFDEKFGFLNSNNVGPSGLRVLTNSTMNYSRVPDGDWIQEHSYILKVGLSAENYNQFYAKTIHPLGVKMILEQTFNDYVPDTVPDPEYEETFEVGYLNNYSSYVINVDYGDNSTYAQGITHYGITYTVGCSLAGDFGDEPTYLFPSWTGNIDYTKFIDIPIYKMFNLNYINSRVNPNENLEC